MVPAESDRAGAAHPDRSNPATTRARNRLPIGSFFLMSSPFDSTRIFLPSERVIQSDHDLVLVVLASRARLDRFVFREHLPFQVEFHVRAGQKRRADDEPALVSVIGVMDVAGDLFVPYIRLQPRVDEILRL